jgi:hypothetical protein
MCPRKSFQRYNEKRKSRHAKTPPGYGTMGSPAKMSSHRIFPRFPGLLNRKTCTIDRPHVISLLVIQATKALPVHCGVGGQGGEHPIVEQNRTLYLPYSRIDSRRPLPNTTRPPHKH